MLDAKKAVILLCFAAFIAITVHHQLICGRLFDLSDMLHHEFFSWLLFAFGAGLSVSYAMEEN